MQGSHVEVRVRSGWLAMVAATLLWAGTARGVTVRLGPEDASSTVLLHVGDRLRVELPTTPAQGYRWRVSEMDASHLVLIGNTVRPENGRLDASGMQVFVWKAVAAGTAAVNIDYLRPNDEKSVAPAKQMKIAAEIARDPLVAAEGDNGGDSLVSSLQKLGTFTGTLACEGCTGIAVSLTLYAADAKELTGTVFTETRRLVGAPGGAKTIAGSGRWAVLHGTYADPAMMVYVLTAPGGGIENWKVDGERLVLLDAQMLPLSGAAIQSLEKVADGEP